MNTRKASQWIMSVVFLSMVVSIAPVMAFQVDEAPVSARVVPVEEIRIDPGTVALRKARLEEAKLSMKGKVAAQALALPAPTDTVTMQIIDECDDIPELGSFGNQVWGIEEDWVNSKYIVKINPTNGKITRSFKTPGRNADSFWGLGVSSNWLYLTNAVEGAIYRINPTTGERVDTFQIDGLEDVISGGAVNPSDGAFWFGQWDYNGNLGGCKLFRLNPKNGNVREIIQIEGARMIHDLAFNAFGNLFVTVSKRNRLLLLRINPNNLNADILSIRRNDCETGLAFLPENRLITTDWCNMQYNWYENLSQFDWETYQP